MSYKLKSIASTRFMSKLLPNLVNYLEWTHKIKYKYGDDYEKCGKCKIKYKDSECSL